MLLMIAIQTFYYIYVTKKNYNVKKIAVTFKVGVIEIYIM